MECFGRFSTYEALPWPYMRNDTDGEGDHEREHQPSL
jgi:hypothetical protein